MGQTERYAQQLIIRSQFARLIEAYLFLPAVVNRFLLNHPTVYEAQSRAACGEDAKRPPVLQHRREREV
jgi:hypothetical protein